MNPAAGRRLRAALPAQSFPRAGAGLAPKRPAAAAAASDAPARGLGLGFCGASSSSSADSAVAASFGAAGTLGNGLLLLGTRARAAPSLAPASAPQPGSSRGFHAVAVVANASRPPSPFASDPRRRPSSARPAMPAAPSLLLLPQSRNVNVFAKFWESVQRQVKERQDFQENVKQLSATSDQIASSDLVKGAKAAAEATGGAVKKVVDTVEKVVESEAVQKTVEVTAKVVGTVGIGWKRDELGERFERR